MSSYNSHAKKFQNNFLGVRIVYFFKYVNIVSANEIVNPLTPGV